MQPSGSQSAKRPFLHDVCPRDVVTTTEGGHKEFTSSLMKTETSSLVKVQRLLRLSPWRISQNHEEKASEIQEMYNQCSVMCKLSSLSVKQNLGNKVSHTCTIAETEEDKWCQLRN